MWRLIGTEVIEMDDGNGEIQTAYQETLLYAAGRHALRNQTLPESDIPYVVHLCNVCMEILIAGHHTESFDLELAVRVALLHDVLEDTETKEEDLTSIFGKNVASCVAGLTKNESVTKSGRMDDSLERIKACPKETWAVKLADRITNLQKPPKSWPLNKITHYREEAKVIHDALQEGNRYLAKRLARKIDEYGKYCLD
jgi:guanosine-3',5'-bis(diphosphate) 3'-pyrophosphohydrolase